MLLPFCPSLVALFATVLAAVAVLARVLCLNLLGPPILNLWILGFRCLTLGICSGGILRWRGCVGATSGAPRPSSLTRGHCCSGGGFSFSCHRWFALAKPRWAPMLRLAVSDSVEEVEAFARQALPSGGGSGNRHDKWACREMARKTRVSLIHPPTSRTIISVLYL